jgi:creatinine amidohydrolase
LGSDSYVAEGVASLVADKLGALRAPLIPVGYSADLAMFPGTLYVKPTAFTSYLDGVCRSLVHWGLNDLLFLNTHLGNVTLIDEIANNLVEEGVAACLQIDWWRFSADRCSDLLTTPWAAGHAGELGTSVMLYLASAYVHLDQAQDFVPESNPWPTGLTRYSSFREITPTGVLGVASAGSVEKGEAVVKRCVEAIVEEAHSYFA